MKKVLLVLGGLLIVASGVAAVSAYEAHLINVTAHVENALTVGTDPMDFGTVFPEEWLWEKTLIQLSTSARKEKTQPGIDPQVGDLVHIEYEIYAEWKPIPEDLLQSVNPQVSGVGGPYYAWLGDALYVGIDLFSIQAGDMIKIGPATTTAPSAQGTGLTGILNGDFEHMLYVAIDTPVFEGYYNQITDRLVNPDGKPSGLQDPTWVIPKDDPQGRWIPDGVDLGLDLKVQVTNIVRIP